MIRLSPSVPGRSLAERAFSLVEAVIAAAIVGLMLVVALNTVGASRVGHYKTAQRSLGHSLAQGLMAEILQQAYEDLALPPGSFGPRYDKTVTGDRSLYDDVDDYDRWSASPPETKLGVVMKGLIGWRRSVSVNWVKPDDLNWVVGGDTGVKGICVKVTHNGVPAATLWAIRTRGVR